MSASTTKYKKAETFILFNEDDDVLHTIRVKLPTPPPLKDIDGYGVDVRKQMFHRVEMPQHLKDLIKSCVNLDEIWEKLNHYKVNYEEDIAFIRREWERRLHGYWFFNNGRPTYIDGWHYFYLNYWKIDIGYPEYRDRDRKFFVFARYAYTTREAFYSYRVLDIKTDKLLAYFNDEKEVKKFAKEKGVERVRAEKGEFIITMNRRLCFGFNYPKYRREGATYKAQCINFCVISLLSNAKGGIQSMDGKSAEITFINHLVKPWRKVPFFFFPRYTGSTNPKILEFDIPSTRIGSKGSIINIDTGLESDISYAESANRGWYDGRKLHFLNNDEIGKTALEDVEERHRVQQKCLSTGNGSNIFGLEINTSTVGEMAKGGGESFYRLCKYSMWDIRDNTGKTESGLFNMFIPSYDGLEGFVDIFGMSIINDPLEKDVWKWTNPTRDSSGKLMGAKRFLEEKIENILLRDDTESIKAYEEELRLHPTSFSQCFITAGAGSGFDIKKVIRRIRELRFDHTATRKGNFKWKNGIINTKVVWEDDDINGRWNISLWLDDSNSNLRIKTIGEDLDGNPKEVWSPLKPWIFTASADPYEFMKTEGRRMSDGAGAVLLERDRNIDPDDKPVSQWETNRIVCTYSHRPKNPDDYAEDMLMMSVYYGAMMFPEINLPLIWNYFVRRGYDGYLKYQRDVNGKWKKTPGFFNKGVNPQRIMELHHRYIDNFCHLHRHIDLLRQLKNIKGVEELTKYDLFVAVGGCFLGSETDYGEFFNTEIEESGGIDISILYP